jgi:endonuclease/exonuclease/phosphatase family metal-dependent hydrolase
MFRVATYNIQKSVGLDGRRQPERILEVLGELDADILALQEVDHETGRTGGVNQAMKLGSLTGMNALFGAAMPYDGGYYGEAILSRLPFEKTENHPLPYSPGHEPRAALAVKVAFPETETAVTFVGTHLDHTGDPADRIAQAKELNRILVGTDKNAKNPVILAGDLNATPGSEPMRRLLEHWQDAAAEKPMPTFPSGQPDRRIDYVLYRPAERWTVVESRVIPEPVASDHCPVLTILEYAP